MQQGLTCRNFSNPAWNPIVTAPTDADLELCVYDNGEYHEADAVILLWPYMLRTIETATVTLSHVSSQEFVASSTR